MQKIFAAIDVGTNSTRLLVAQLMENGQLLPLCTDLAVTRIGEQMHKALLMPWAMERTLSAIEKFARCAHDYAPQNIVIAATSAVRSAANSAEFACMVQESLGIELNILSGSQEAYLSYLGVKSVFGDIADSLVIDIGGGSTEFIWTENGEQRFLSTNAGAVRLMEKRLANKSSTDVTLNWQEEWLGDALRLVLAECPKEIIGVGGTVTTLAAMAQQIAVYDGYKTHGYRLTTAQVNELACTLHRLTLEERIKLPGLEPKRADIIPAGADILRTILGTLDKDSLLVCEADILFGLILNFTHNTA